MSDNDRNGLWIMVLVWLVVVAFAMGFLVRDSFGQTPPVSTIAALPDTSAGTEILLEVTVQSSIPWDQEWVGVYYRIPELETGWLYIGACVAQLLFEPPVDNRLIEFASQVNDNEGNQEPYPHQRPEPQAEASSFYCALCEPVDPCPRPSTLEAVVILAENGFDMQADTPFLQWWWTHPMEGSPVVEYLAEWEVDGIVSHIGGIAPGDTTFAFWNAPYTVGQTQRLRVQGKDAQQRTGPFSLWSDPFTDQGPPGSPAKANGTLIMVD